MESRQRFSMLGLGLAVMLAGCAAPQAPGAAQPGAPAVPAPAGPKRITAAIMFDLPVVRSQLNALAGGTFPGAPELEELVHAGLTIADNADTLRPQLAEAVPSAENGLWKVFPDGRMETTWRIRPGARWHDGVAFTPDDLLFTAAVSRDRELPIFRHLAYDFIDGIQAVDPHTVTIYWTRPFIQADRMFAAAGSPHATPLPRHLLEAPYQKDRAAFTSLPYWSADFVGTGPYQVREWSAGSHALLDAFDGYILGRPRIDQIELKFISDPNTLLANVLAGVVEVPVGRSITFEAALQLREQWRDGQVDFSPGGSLKLWPQHLYPNPAVIGDVRFRRALLHAIDRQTLADSLLAGFGPVAHTTITPTEAGYQDIEGSIVRYEYDPRKATQTIAGLGYTKGPDGTFRDAGGEKLGGDIRVGVHDLLRKTVAAAAQDWQMIGIAAEVSFYPPQRQNDMEYTATFPGFYITRGSAGFGSLRHFHSAEAKTPENRYTGRSTGNYKSQALDGLIDRYVRTVPWRERMDVAAQIVHHLTDQVAVMDMFYDATPSMAGNRLVNVPMQRAAGATATWNVHEWDVRS